MSLRPHKQLSKAERVEQPAAQEDIAQWVEMVQTKERLGGVTAVGEVWEAMRSKKIDLPTHGEDAESLWPTFLRAFHDKQLPMEALLDYAIDLKQRTGHQYAGLYAGIVGPVLKRDGDPYPWHQQLLKEDLAPQNPIKHLVPYLPDTKRSRKQFKALYTMCQERDLYDLVMSRVLVTCRARAVYSWHEFFIKSGDYPSADFANDPAVRALLAGEDSTGRDRKTSLSSLPPNGIVPDYAAPYMPLTRASMNTLVGDVHGIEKREVSDNFCARLFATQMFNVNLVIRSLHFFAVETLGPLTVREMAARCGSIEAMNESVRRLADLNIRIGDSTYARLARKVLEIKSPGLFDTFLASDVHPEAFDDSHTMEKLLAMYLAEEDWSQVHLIMCALSATAGPRLSYKAWNALLQHHAIARDYPSVKYTLQQMQAHGMRLRLRSLTLLHRYCLTHRSPGKRPATQSGRPTYGSLSLVTQACISAAERGQHVNPALWVECLKRYGMTVRFGEIEKLAIFLSSHYDSRSWSLLERRILENTIGPGSILGNTVGEGRLRRATLLDAPSMRYMSNKSLSALYLRRIFSSEMVKAIITWGFNSAARRKLLRPGQQDQPMASGSDTSALQEWARGLALVKRIVQDSHVYAPERVVRDALKLRIKMLFGPAYSTKRFNQVVRRVNGLSVAHYIRHANEVWGSALFSIDPNLLQTDDSDFETEARILFALFGPQSRVSRQRHESADILNWAASLPYDRYRAYSSITKQKYDWHDSPYRIEHPKTSPATQSHYDPPVS
ncbi:hypothetical protein MBLNU230_g6827t1 [Neophaeotheca triangularis]